MTTQAKPAQAKPFTSATGGSSYQYGRLCTVSIPRFVGMIGKARVFGGGWVTKEEKVWDAIIDAAENKIPKPAIRTAHNVPQELVDSAKCDLAYLSLDWLDGGIPQLRRSWWAEAAAWIASIDGNVLICCQGGIGRTGTALASLFGTYYLDVIGLAVAESDFADSIVAWVRGEYHNEAIETDTQIEYLEFELGLPVAKTDEGSMWVVTRESVVTAPTQYDDTKPYGTLADDVPMGKDEIDKMFDDPSKFCFDCGVRKGEQHKSNCVALDWEERFNDWEDDDTTSKK